MSIRLRLILALGALLIATIVAMVTALLIDAQERVQNEVASSMRVTETLLRSSLSSLDGASDAPARVRGLVASLQNLRHVEIALASGKSAVSAPDDGRRKQQPGFAIVSASTLDSVVVPVMVAGRKSDDIIITAVVNDELAEVWETITRVSWYAVALGAGGFVLTSLLINSALSPVHDLARALHLLEEGNYNVAVPSAGPPEIAAIASEVNALAAALQKERDCNRQLSTAIIRAQDDERQDIARELHDELGPYLFAIRASGAALSRALGQSPPDAEKANLLAGNVQQHVDALQTTNRRVLQQLSPVGLDELGLSAAIEAIANLWRKQQPSCGLLLQTDGDLDALDRTLALTVYRMVQEGLTNAFRHAGASRIDVAVSVSLPAAGEVRKVCIKISDDGVGLPEEAHDGFGLRGMRERIGALGGSLIIANSERGGTQLSAAIPLSRIP